MLNIVKNIIKGIKLNWVYFTSSIHDNDSLYFYEHDINEHGYMMRHNAKRLMQIKASVCLCQLIKFNNGKIVPCFFIDGLFNTLSKETQEFVIQHEMGHFNLHQDILLNAKGLVRNDEIEFQADEYGMSKVGKEKAIKALKELQDLSITLNFGFGKNTSYYKEYNRRIENLMNK